jgi:very-short-patch-repair endonuclease
MAPTPSPAKVRDAIAETMWACVSAHDLCHACDALGMPDGPSDGDPWKSKRRYVRNRLMTLSAPEVAEMARAVAEQYDDVELGALLAPVGLHGVDGELKNLIFAAHGPKPRIVLRDAINNVIEIVEHADACLVYDRALDAAGLSWGALTAWWAESSPRAGDDPARSLYTRLRASVESPAEKMLFNAYGARYGGDGGDQVPALIPQVYLHYDPYTLRELAHRNGQVLPRQRMDFLLLLADRSRIVIEVDGKQHYADGDTASPNRYAAMVAEDRKLRLAGYEVYRFGGAELHPDDPDAPARAQRFFDELLDRHRAAHLEQIAGFRSSGPSTF